MLVQLMSLVEPEIEPTRFDIEYPCGCCTPFAGIRGEYGYTWTDILQHQNRADLQYLGLLFNLGVRF